MCKNCPFGEILVHNHNCSDCWRVISKDLTTVQVSERSQEILKVKKIEYDSHFIYFIFGVDDELNVPQFTDVDGCRIFKGSLNEEELKKWGITRRKEIF